LFCVFDRCRAVGLHRYQGRYRRVRPTSLTLTLAADEELTRRDVVNFRFTRALSNQIVKDKGIRVNAGMSWSRPPFSFRVLALALAHFGIPMRVADISVRLGFWVMGTVCPGPIWTPLVSIRFGPLGHADMGEAD
jgi:hypothetical protein